MVSSKIFPTKVIYTTTISTPVGELIAGAVNEGICLFDFSRRRMMGNILKRLQLHLGAELQEGEHPHFEQLKVQVEEYFSGGRWDFDLPLVFAGTEFQKRVWTELQQIPYGEVRTYKEQAIRLGDALVIRAVARANGENCLAIIVPCHRVFAANGDLTGYSGGISKKKWLLKHEQKHSATQVQLEMFS